MSKTYEVSLHIVVEVEEDDDGNVHVTSIDNADFQAAPGYDDYSVWDGDHWISHDPAYNAAERAMCELLDAFDAAYK